METQTIMQEIKLSCPHCRADLTKEGYELVCSIMGSEEYANNIISINRSMNRIKEHFDRLQNDTKVCAQVLEKAKVDTKNALFSIGCRNREIIEGDE